MYGAKIDGLLSIQVADLKEINVSKNGRMYSFGNDGCNIILL